MDTNLPFQTTAGSSFFPGFGLGFGGFGGGFGGFGAFGDRGISTKDAVFTTQIGNVRDIAAVALGQVHQTVHFDNQLSAMGQKLQDAIYQTQILIRDQHQRSVEQELLLLKIKCMPNCPCAPPAPPVAPPVAVAALR